MTTLQVPFIHFSSENFVTGFTGTGTLKVDAFQKLPRFDLLRFRKFLSFVFAYINMLQNSCSAICFYYLPKGQSNHVNLTNVNLIATL